MGAARVGSSRTPGALESSAEVGIPGQGPPHDKEDPMTDSAATTVAPWADWLRRWDAQQGVYIEDRERGFEVMFSSAGSGVGGGAWRGLLRCGALHDRHPLATARGVGRGLPRRRGPAGALRDPAQRRQPAFPALPTPDPGSGGADRQTPPAAGAGRWSSRPPTEPECGQASRHWTSTRLPCSRPVSRRWQRSGRTFTRGSSSLADDEVVRPTSPHNPVGGAELGLWVRPRRRRAGQRPRAAVIVWR